MDSDWNLSTSSWVMVRSSSIVSWFRVVTSWFDWALKTAPSWPLLMHQNRPTGSWVMERLSSTVSWCVQFLHHCTRLKKLPLKDPSHIKSSQQDHKLQSKYWNVVAYKSNWWQPPHSIPTKGKVYPYPIEVIWTVKSLNNFLRDIKIS